MPGKSIPPALRKTITIDTISRISTQHTGLGYPIHRLSFRSVHSVGESSFHQPCDKDKSHECDSRSIDATNKQVWDVQSTDPHEQTTKKNNKINFVHVFPSDIKPRFLKNLPHLRVRFHGYVIIWEMATKTNENNQQTNSQCWGNPFHQHCERNPYEQLHHQHQQKNVHVHSVAVKNPWKLIGHRPIFQCHRISTPDMLGEPRATDMAILSAVRSQFKKKLYIRWLAGYTKGETFGSLSFTQMFFHWSSTRS